MGGGGIFGGGGGIFGILRYPYHYQQILLTRALLPDLLINVTVMRLVGPA